LIEVKRVGGDILLGENRGSPHYGKHYGDSEEKQGAGIKTGTAMHEWLTPLGPIIVTIVKDSVIPVALQQVKPEKVRQPWGIVA